MREAMNREPGNEDREMKKKKASEVIQIAVSTTVSEDEIFSAYPGFEYYDPKKHDIEGIEPEEDTMGIGLPGATATIVKLEK